MTDAPELEKAMVAVCDVIVAAGYEVDNDGDSESLSVFCLTGKQNHVSLNIADIVTAAWNTRADIADTQPQCDRGSVIEAAAMRFEGYAKLNGCTPDGVGAFNTCARELHALAKNVTRTDTLQSDRNAVLEGVASDIEHGLSLFKTDSSLTAIERARQFFYTALAALQSTPAQKQVDYWQGTQEPRATIKQRAERYAKALQSTPAQVTEGWQPIETLPDEGWFLFTDGKMRWTDWAGIPSDVRKWLEGIEGVKATHWAHPLPALSAIKETPNG